MKESGVMKTELTRVQLQLQVEIEIRIDRERIKQMADDKQYKELQVLIRSITIKHS